MSELTAQEFHTRVHDLCLRNAARAQRDCKVCGGTGEDYTNWENPHPCPTCQPTVQKWTERAKGYEVWHELLDVKKSGDGCVMVCTCGGHYYAKFGNTLAEDMGMDEIDYIEFHMLVWMHGEYKNPTYSDIESIKAVLEDVGEWERFKLWLDYNYAIGKLEFASRKHIGDVAIPLIELATCPGPFLQAAGTFIEGVE